VRALVLGVDSVTSRLSNLACQSPPSILPPAAAAVFAGAGLLGSGSLYGAGFAQPKVGGDGCAGEAVPVGAAVSREAHGVRETGEF